MLPSSIPAALTATKTIPIVFNSGDDPVRLGFVVSLNRPGGNATGVAIFSNELAAKRLDLLRQLVPHSRSIAVLLNADFGPSARFRADVEAAAGALGLATPIPQASKPDEIETAFDNLAQTRPDALLIGPGPFLDSHRDLLVAHAAKIAIPTAYETRASALAGGLVSYGADVADAYRQAGVYAGRVLNGEKAADLPVLRVTKLELVINLKTAKTLGLDLPANILAVADEVIE
jgi:putative tryptophan/tyrosine transport system substrate-binding protein